MGLQDAYRDITVSTTKINGETVGVVEYYHDVHKRGYTETTQHIVYVFEGKLSRYHLDFAALDDQFEDLRDLFAEMAELFVYLEVLPY